MKTITIGFSKSKKKIAIGSWLIRKYMGTSYSHVSFHFNTSTMNRTLVYEAVGSGIRFIEKSNWEKYAELVVSYEIEVSNEIYVRMMQTCIDNAGLKYGYMQNIGVIIAKLFKLEYNPFPENDNCSELLLRLLIEAGYSIEKSHDLVTPLDIENMLKQPYIAKELI